MSCKCPKGWCYHMKNCRNAAPVERLEDIDTNEPGDLSPQDERLAAGLQEAPALPSNGPQAARLENLLKRQAELVDELARSPNPSVALRTAAKLIAAAIDRVQHEGTPIDWRTAS